MIDTPSGRLPPPEPRLRQTARRGPPPGDGGRTRRRLRAPRSDDRGDDLVGSGGAAHAAGQQNPVRTPCGPVQDQEKTEKNIARYVISKELKQAVDLLRDAGLEKTVRFYKGSPTCFTILCEGQKVMLVNPYPYEREAFNSWTVVFREASQGIFTSFKSAHIDQPWKNEQLTVPWSVDCESAIMERFRDDVSRAPEELKKELGAGDEKVGY